jgi:hypothetical protein
MQSIYYRAIFSLVAGMAIAGLIAIGCSSSGPSGDPSMKAATVNVSLSDPATCQAPNGEFSHVYVAITDVKASTNANAGDNDSSFVDLTPNLASSPMQVDLLGQANNQCFLAMLGSTQELQAGSYQQIRIILAPDSQGASIANNACGSFANCVVTSNGTVHDLALSSEAQTGLKIPSGQISNGQFTVAAGQTEDIDIDFNTCSSIIQEGNGTYRLKPVLHAGEVSTTSTSINGTVVDSLTGKPIADGVAVVAAEQKDANGVDRIVMSTLTDANGGFVFCPLPAGSYDIVAVGPATLANGTVPGVAYSAGVVLSVQPGETVGNIPLISNTLESSLNGLVTTQNGAAPPAGTVADLQLAALQQIPGNGPTITVPQLPLMPGVAGISSAYNPNGTYITAAGGSCAANVDCVSYVLYVPSVWPNVATYQSSGSQFSQSTSTPVNYAVDAEAEVPGSGGTLDCSPSEMQVNTTTAGGPLTAASGNAATIAFVSCQ